MSTAQALGEILVLNDSAPGFSRREVNRFQRWRRGLAIFLGGGREAIKGVFMEYCIRERSARKDMEAQ